MDATCKHCGRPIVQGPPTPDPYWYHPANQSVYCADRRAGAYPPADAKRATPAQERKRA